jgi:hypothetical protein
MGLELGNFRLQGLGIAFGTAAPVDQRANVLLDQLSTVLELVRVVLADPESFVHGRSMFSGVPHQTLELRPELDHDPWRPIVEDIGRRGEEFGDVR